jgi:EAL domain-containing protein (putative c-di-GMP-specific phosphodiesterase class I)
MYRAKERGGAGCELFDEAMRGSAAARFEVENDLRRALERDELSLAYQPIVSLDDGRIVAVEALLRWTHPVRGAVPPVEFIPIAEESGLIEPIGRWVLATACREAAAWCKTWPEVLPMGISVNVSGVQIARPDLPEVIAGVLSATGLEPQRLNLEVTENVMLRDADALLAAMPALKETGVRLMLDDFGTGYSSLAYLTRLPLDALKVDRRFIDGLGTDARSNAITEAIIAMASALSLDVVAEGIETPLQVSELTRMHCKLVQGFYYSRPVTAERIAGMLRDPVLPKT